MKRIIILMLLICGSAHADDIYATDVVRYWKDGGEAKSFAQALVIGSIEGVLYGQSYMAANARGMNDGELDVGQTTMGGVAYLYGCDVLQQTREDVVIAWIAHVQSVVEEADNVDYATASLSFLIQNCGTKMDILTITTMKQEAPKVKS